MLRNLTCEQEKKIMFGVRKANQAVSYNAGNTPFSMQSLSVKIRQQEMKLVRYDQFRKANI